MHSHSILQKKLTKMEINGSQTILWGGRKKLTIIVPLDELSLDISVIQGSILGLILFLCYINDFFAATSLFPVL